MNVPRPLSAPEHAATAANEAVFHEITEALRARRAIGFTGAGVSNPAGYPTWGELLDNFDKQFEETFGNDDRAQFIRREADPVWRAEEYKTALGEATYQEIFSRTFGGRPAPALTPFYRSLLSIPFSHIVTTNYDLLLEDLHAQLHGPEAFESISWEDSTRVAQFIGRLSNASARRCYVHLHGRIGRADGNGGGPANYYNNDLVLCEADYVRRYVLSEDARKKLFALFATQQVVFLGFSMQDAELNRILREVHAFLRSGEVRHFAVFPLRERDDAPELLRERYRQRFGVNPLFYPAYEGYSLFADVLAALAQGDVKQLPALTGGLVEAKSGPSRKKIAVAAYADAPLLAATRGVAPKPAAAKPPVDPNDPHKNQWGGSPEANGRRVEATVASHGGGWYRVRLRVVALPGAPAVGEPVRFHLHPTFPEAVQLGTKHGAAYELEVIAYGAFTVGVECDGGKTQLELDLAEDPRFPAGFRNN